MGHFINCKVLFRSTTLEKIKTKEVTIAIRKWKRPTVKEGGTLVTRAGLLRIDTVTKISLDDISEDDLKRAGYSQREDIVSYVNKKKEGILYKVEFHLEGEDPRIALRQNTDISTEDFEEISYKLDRFDKFSKKGPWVFQILGLIEKNPERLAQELADEMGVEKSWFKPNVRKLKKLGLTISLKIGYRISPRGKAFLEIKRSK